MYEILWRSKSHLFAATVTALAYSRYSADYNCTDRFAILYENKEMTFYLDKSSLAMRVKRSQEYFSQLPNLNLYLAECKSLESAYKAFYYSLASEYSAASNEKLATLFTSLLHLQARCASLYQGTNEYGTKFLQDRLVAELKKHTGDWQDALAKIAVGHPNEIEQEEQDYAALLKSRNPDLIGHIKKHPWVCGKAFLMEEAVTELAELMKTRRPRESKEKPENKFAHLLENPAIAETACLLREFSALRITLKTLLQHKLLGSPIFKEIATRMEVKPSELVYTFDADEILKWLYLKKPSKPNCIAGNRIYLCHGNEVKLLGEKGIVEFKQLLEKEEAVDELHGATVSPGKAKGIARIILPNRLSEMSSNTFNKGDILITTMTNPNMIFLASKASAIVTDDGGITCHAAIISRELKKPCIVGTRKATTIFKDGDLVEVDADNGIVKKVSPSVQ